MSDLRPEGTKITLGGVEYGLLFSVIAIDEIQDHFKKSIYDLPEIMKDELKHWANTAYILTVLINEDIEYKNEKRKEKLSLVEEKMIARRITPAIYKMATAKILEAFRTSVPEFDSSDPHQGE